MNVIDKVTDEAKIALLEKIRSDTVSWRTEMELLGESKPYVICLGSVEYRPSGPDWVHSRVENECDR